MDTALHEALERWGNFYLIAGSAAAALTGLQFVVQTLIASDIVSSFMLARGKDGPLFVLAASTMLLISVGIHNAWDTVTYMTVNVVRAKANAGVPAPPTSAPVRDSVTTAP